MKSIKKILLGIAILLFSYPFFFIGGDGVGGAGIPIEIGCLLAIVGFVISLIGYYTDHQN